jgi:hypothetical protein
MSKGMVLIADERINQVVICFKNGGGDVHRAACLPGKRVEDTDFGGYEFIPDDYQKLECTDCGENMLPANGDSINAVPWSELSEARQKELSNG